MTDELELVRRLGAETPPPSERAWTAVRTALAHAIDQERDSFRRARRRARWRSPRVFACGLGVVALTGAAAYGATQVIGVGSPAPPARNELRILLSPRGVNLLGLRVADPSGGPPWGVRLTLSTPRAPAHGVRHALGNRRTVVSVQVGRIFDGHLGFIGEDNAFNDDRLFHFAGPTSALMTPVDYAIAGTPQRPVLPTTHRFDLVLPTVTSAAEGCSSVHVRLHDPRAVRVLRQDLEVLRRDGPAARSLARRSGVSVAALQARTAKQLRTIQRIGKGATERTFATCPHKDLRTVIVGFVGPGATAVTISGDGLHDSEHLTTNDDGFYLFVLDKQWSRTLTFKATVACSDGRTDSGPATPSAAGPNAPHCPTA